MGNCAFRGNEELPGRNSNIVRVITTNGGILELRPPVTAECITNGFPGHGIYRNITSRPILHNEELVGGEMYRLRPINDPPFTAMPSAVAPYRVSFDPQGLWRRQELDQGVHRNSINNSGLMWKVNLVISPEELKEILSTESRTEELIESVRAVVKCGINGSAAGSSVASSDQWSLASSRKES